MGVYKGAGICFVIAVFSAKVGNGWADSAALDCAVLGFLLGSCAEPFLIDAETIAAAVTDFFSSPCFRSNSSTRLSRLSSTSVLGPRFLGTASYRQGHWKSLQDSHLGRRRLHLIFRLRQDLQFMTSFCSTLDRCTPELGSRSMDMAGRVMMVAILKQQRSLDESRCSPSLEQSDCETLFDYLLQEVSQSNVQYCAKLAPLSLTHGLFPVHRPTGW